MATPLRTTTGLAVSPGGMKLRTTPSSTRRGPSTNACINDVVSCWPCGMCTTSGTRIRPLGSKKYSEASWKFSSKKSAGTSSAFGACAISHSPSSTCIGKLTRDAAGLSRPTQ